MSQSTLLVHSLRAPREAIRNHKTSPDCAIISSLNLLPVSNHLSPRRPLWAAGQKQRCLTHGVDSIRFSCRFSHTTWVWVVDLTLSLLPKQLHSCVYHWWIDLHDSRGQVWGNMWRPTVLPGSIFGILFNIDTCKPSPRVLLRLS